MENMENTEIFVVMDTETNWCNEVMSIGVAIANCETFELIDTRYYILNPEYLIGGMFSAVLQINGNPPAIECNRREAVCDLKKWLDKYNVQSVFAYNAFFDYSHLEELAGFNWYDIIKLRLINSLIQKFLKVPNAVKQAD